MFWVHGPRPEYTTKCVNCLHYGSPDFNDIEKKWYHFISYGAIGVPAIKYECEASDLRRLDNPNLFLPTQAYNVDKPLD